MSVARRTGAEIEDHVLSRRVEMSASASLENAQNYGFIAAGADGS